MLISMLMLVSTKAVCDEGQPKESGADSGKTKVGVLRLVGPPWEPFLYEQQPRKGLATEIVVEALERSGYQFEIAIKPWRRVLAESKKNAADILIGLWFNAERAKSYAYSDPYYVNQISFITTKEKVFSYQKIGDLNGLRIGVRKGASFGDEFDEAYYLDKYPMLNSSSMLQMLALGRIDVGVDDRLILSRMLQKDSELGAQLSFVEGDLTSRPLHMAVTKSLPGHQQVIDDFNEALAKMKREGRLQEVIGRYKR